MWCELILPPPFSVSNSEVLKGPHFDEVLKGPHFDQEHIKKGFGKLID